MRRPVRTAAVLTHRQPETAGPALGRLLELAAERQVVLCFDSAETVKHRLSASELVRVDCAPDPCVDVCFALGGDGTILSALRSYAGTGVPVFAINYGEMGFLATVDRDDFEVGVIRGLGGEYEVMSLPAIELSGGGGRWLGINDASMHRQQGRRVADLEYAVGGDSIGRVRCDGLVIATAAGSTGYNLANGGPVMAWGVHGYVVSFIAPHSLTARTLVVAPDDLLTIHNRSFEEPVDVTVDGRPVCLLEPGEWLQARFATDQGALAQMPGTTFYQRLRQKFGRLAEPL